MLLALTASAPAAVFAQPSTPYVERFDLSANAVVDGGDASVAARNWADLHEQNACALAGSGALDLSGDGCVSVADVQRLAAGMGGASSAAPRPDAALSGEFVWTVTGTSDEPDLTPGDGACQSFNQRCTLRAAIQEANSSPGPDLIKFAVRNKDRSCPALVTISPDSKTNGILTLDDPNGYGTIIDGYSQCGASENNQDVHGNAVIKVELRGSFQYGIHGLQLLSQNNVVRGLAIFNWDRQVEIFGGRARYNRLEGNVIGTNAAQVHKSKKMTTRHTEGIRIQIRAHHNIVGCGSFNADDTFVPCDQAGANAARNIVAGNGDDGIHIEETYYNHFVGNYVGLKQDGVTALRNGSDGVDFEQAPQFNWLGGLTPPERNVVSGNTSEGIEISHNTQTKFNHVAGNYFGLDATGLKALQNESNGISFEDTVDQNYVHGNYVSGNKRNGVRFYVLATRNQVYNNVIGLSVDGRPLPNLAANGVYVMGGSSHNIIRENVIAHHPDAGIYLSNISDDDNNGFGTTFYNTISRNSMYGNGREGILFGQIRGIYANEGLPAPALTQANTLRVSGTACPGCKIELFVADKAKLTPGGGDESGEGKTFVGEGMSDGAGNFTFNISEVPLGSVLTASATDVKGNTSMFGENIVVSTVGIPDPTVAPTLTATPTATETPPANPSATPEPANPTATLDPVDPGTTPSPTGIPGSEATPTATVQPGNNPAATYRISLPLLGN